MTWDFGGWMWMIIDLGALVVLGAALFYGTRRWAGRRRDPATLQAQEDATRELYRRERSDVGDQPAPGTRAAGR